MKTIILIPVFLCLFLFSSASPAKIALAAGIYTNPSNFTLDEDGCSEYFRVYLNTQPTADVEISIASSNTTEATVSTNLVTLTSLNWNTGKVVWIQPLEDFIVDGDQPLNIVIGPAVSSDPAYQGLGPEYVSVTVNNIDPFPGSGCTSFPVSLTGFEAENVGESILLQWLSLSEQNFSGFDLQHSLDGTSWTSLAFIPGIGTFDRSQFYQYTDQYPPSGINYYRLKQIDQDGSYVFSSMIHVWRKPNDSPAPKIFPNPVRSDRIFISFPGISPEGFRFRLYDSSGRKRKDQSFLSDRYEIIVSDLPGGMYWVHLIWQGNSSRQLLVLE